VALVDPIWPIIRGARPRILIKGRRILEFAPTAMGSSADGEQTEIRRLG